MQNSDVKTWALIMICLTGGVFQITKSLAPSPRRATADVSAVLDREDQPYSVHAKGGGRVARVEADEAILNGTRQTTPAVTTADAAILHAPGPTVGTSFEEKVGDKKDEKCVKKIDPKTGEEVCKKKKKKKKSKVAELHDEVLAPLPKVAPKGASDAAGIEWGVASVVAANRVNVKNTEPDRAFESIEAWRKRLLDTPSLSETKVFIDHFQRNLVTADIFYKLTQEMMDDSRVDMKLLGVMCASLSTSVISFQMLAELAEKERSGSTVRTQIEASLSRYTDLNSLGILANVMRADQTGYTPLVAVQKFDIAAKRYLTVATTTPTTTTPAATATGTATKTTVTARNRASFTKFVTILQGLSKSTDATLRTQAASSLTNLQALLTVAPTTPVPGADQPTTVAVNGAYR